MVDRCIKATFASQRYEYLYHELLRFIHRTLDLVISMYKLNIDLLLFYHSFFFYVKNFSDM